MMEDFNNQLNPEMYFRGGHKGRKHRQYGAQTFRRGRALEFLNQLVVKRNTLRQQLDAPEFHEIRQVIQGELKMLESVIDDYTRHFELHESEELL